MKRKLLLSLIAMTTLVGASTSAVADVGSSQNNAVSTWKVENKAKRDAYKLALANFVTAKKTYVAYRKAINAKFHTDVNVLKTSTRAAVEAASTAEAKNLAIAAGKISLAKLIADRKLAIASLQKPIKPIKPTYSIRPSK